MRSALIITAMLTSQLFAESAEESINQMYRVLAIDEEKLSDSALLQSFGLEEPRRETRFPAAIEQVDPNVDAQWKRILLPTSIIMTWASIGLTEGAKWQADQTGSYDIAWKEDYHLYRAFTGAGLLATPFLAMSMKGTKSNFKSAAISNLIGWGLYEVTVAHVSNRGQSARPKFHMLGHRFDRPSSAQVLLFSVLSSMVISYSF